MKYLFNAPSDYVPKKMKCCGEPVKANSSKNGQRDIAIPLDDLVKTELDPGELGLCRIRGA